MFRYFGQSKEALTKRKIAGNIANEVLEQLPLRYIGKNVCELQQQLRTFMHTANTNSFLPPFVIDPPSFIDNKKSHFKALQAFIVELIEKFVLENKYLSMSNLLEKIVRNEVVWVGIILEKLLDILSNSQNKAYLINIAMRNSDPTYLKLYIKPNIYSEQLKQAIYSADENKFFNDATPASRFSLS